MDESEFPNPLQDQNDRFGKFLGPSAIGDSQRRPFGNDVESKEKEEIRKLRENVGL
jgi:hypothetical protein